MSKRRPIPKLTCDSALRVKLVHENARMPTRGTQFSAGLDLYVCSERPIEVSAVAVFVGCGFAIEIPPGYVGLIRPRSSTDGRGFTIVEGTIDADFRGELMFKVRSTVGPQLLHHGDRVAQLVIVESPLWDVEVVDELSATDRGANGYGSTGK